MLQKFRGQTFLLVLSPQQGHMLYTEKSHIFCFSVYCIYEDHQAEGRKQLTTELLSLNKRSNGKCSPSLESWICRLLLGSEMPIMAHVDMLFTL